MERHEVENYFVAPTYRKGQREALLGIINAFEGGCKYVMLEAPVGSGKSHIARALAFYYKSSYILTVQKILQNQYMRDFSDMFVMKGRGAYTCQLQYKGEVVSCAEGACKLHPDLAHKDCPYKLAKLQAVASPVTVYNFDSFYYQNLFRSSGYRGLMVLDEAHACEGKFVEFNSFSLSNYKMREEIIPELKTLREYDIYIQKSLVGILSTISSIEGGGVSSPKTIRYLDDLHSMAKRMDRYFINRDKGIEYVHTYSKKQDVTTVTFRPVYAGSFIRTYLLGKAERFLFMSGTLLDKEMFCRSIGIDPEEATFITSESAFPAANRPIRFFFAGSMTMTHKERTFPVLMDRIEEILRRNPNKRGIIQTHNDEIVRFIKEWISVKYRDRLTFKADYASVDDMLEAHEGKVNSFIVASGFREGLDLYDDLSRVQVLCKVPYPSLKDNRVKLLADRSDDYYGWMTVMMFVQSIGRSVRSENDKALTYILDSDFKRMYGKYKRFIPKYVKDAIIWPETV
jgi:ATP-dependent DNA helicase DinG